MPSASATPGVAATSVATELRSTALVAVADPSLAKRTGARIDASVAAAEAIQPPFDQEIIGDDEAPGRRRLRKLIDNLVEQSKDLVESAGAIGITRLTLQQP